MTEETTSLGLLLNLEKVTDDLNTTLGKMLNTTYVVDLRDVNISLGIDLTKYEDTNMIGIHVCGYAISECKMVESTSLCIGKLTKLDLCSAINKVMKKMTQI